MTSEDIAMMGTVGWWDRISSPTLVQDSQNPSQDAPSDDAPETAQSCSYQPRSRSGRGSGRVSDTTACVHVAVSACPDWPALPGASNG